jgi:DNA-directed RNA polymerase subunit RPC12/RpoP
MASATFSCPNCGTPIVTRDPEATLTVDCLGCGHRYLLEFDDFREEYQLLPEEPPQIPTDIDTDRI